MITISNIMRSNTMRFGKEETYKEKYMRCLQALAQEGNPDAMYELAHIYYYRKKKTKKQKNEDFMDAFSWFQTATQQGHIDSYQMLDRMNKRGELCEFCQYHFKKAKKKFFRLSVRGKSC